MSDVDLGLPALALLCLISIVCGFVMLAVLRATSDLVSLAKVKNRMVAHLLEMRLFGDEPALVLRAQRDVVIQSLRLMKHLLVPATVMTLPMLFVLAQMDAIFGKYPLIPGQPGVVTAYGNAAGTEIHLDATEGFAVETPAVRIGSEREVSWRIRPLREGQGVLRLASGGHVWTKSITAGRGMAYVSERRTRMGADFPLHSAELPLPSGAIEWIEVSYGNAVICGLHWLIWFTLISGAVAAGGLFFRNVRVSSRRY